MGASTGDMLVDDPAVLEQVFEHAPVMVVTHCEHSPTIWENEAHAKAEFGDNVPMSEHPNIRSAAACLQSSSMAVDLARRHDALLHVLHLTTAIEMGLFSKAHRSEKRITAEVCVHHLWFDESSYEGLGTRIKCNPAIKTAEDRKALVEALNDGRIDIVATKMAIGSRLAIDGSPQVQVPYDGRRAHVKVLLDQGNDIIVRDGASAKGLHSQRERVGDTDGVRNLKL